MNTWNKNKLQLKANLQKNSATVGYFKFYFIELTN